MKKTRLFENPEVLFTLRQLLLSLKTDQQLFPSKLELPSNEKAIVTELLEALNSIAITHKKIMAFNKEIDSLRDQLITTMPADSSLTSPHYGYGYFIFDINESNYNPNSVTIDKIDTATRRINAEKSTLEFYAKEFQDKLKKLKTNKLPEKIMQQAEKASSFIGRLQLFIENLLNQAERIVDRLKNKPKPKSSKKPLLEEPTCELTTYNPGNGA